MLKKKKKKKNSKHLKQWPKLKQEKEIDFVIMNGENVADGMGITHKLYKEMLRIGADVVTLGNHTWAKKDVFSFIEEEERLIRPANYSKGLLGKGYVIVECKQKKIAVTPIANNILAPFLHYLDAGWPRTTRSTRCVLFNRIKPVINS